MPSPIPKAIIRNAVLEVLNMRPGFGKTEKQIHDFTNTLVGGGVSLQDLRDALDWNLRERYIREHSEKGEDTLWFITENGIAKLNII